MLSLILSLFAVQVAVSQVSFDTSYEGKQGTDLNLLNVKATTSSGASLPVGALTSVGAGRNTGVVVIHPGTIISVTPNGGGGTKYYQFSSKPRGSRWKANSHTMWKVSSHTSAVSDPTVFGQTVPDPSQIENADLLSWINGGATVIVRKWTNLDGAEKTDTFPLAHYSGAHRAMENYYYFDEGDYDDDYYGEYYDDADTYYDDEYIGYRRTANKRTQQKLQRIARLQRLIEMELQSLNRF